MKSFLAAYVCLIATSGCGTRPSYSVTASDTSLPSYLYTLDEAQQITTLVDPYRPQAKHDPDEGTVAASAANQQHFIQDFLNTIMSLPAFHPGRNLKVRVIDSPDPDAYENGFQTITITTAQLDAANLPNLLAILCHESAHSAKNSAAWLDDEFQKSLADREDLLHTHYDSFIKEHYNAQTQVFTQDTRAYNILVSEWNDVETKRAALVKRSESEADIVGAMICGAIGMPTERFIAVTSNPNFADPPAADESLKPRASLLADGATANVPEDQLINFLFIIPSNHPSQLERIEQLRRVKPAIDQFVDLTKTYYADWNQHFSIQ